MRISWLPCLLLLWLPVTGHAEVESHVVQSFRTDAPLLDMAVTSDGKYIYVLTKKATLQVFTANGTLKERLNVGKDVDRLRVGRRDDLVYLINSRGNRIEALQLTFVQHFTSTGSPVKGPENAPVTVAVFSDFQ